MCNIVLHMHSIGIKITFNDDLIDYDDGSYYKMNKSWKSNGFESMIMLYHFMVWYISSLLECIY